MEGFGCCWVGGVDARVWARAAAVVVGDAETGELGGSLVLFACGSKEDIADVSFGGIAEIWALVMGGVASLTFFGYYEFQWSPLPLLPPRLLRNRTILCGSALGFFHFVSQYCYEAFFTSFLQYVPPRTAKTSLTSHAESRESTRSPTRPTSPNPTSFPPPPPPSSPASAPKSRSGTAGSGSSASSSTWQGRG